MTLLFHPFRVTHLFVVEISTLNCLINKAKTMSFEKKNDKIYCSFTQLCYICINSTRFAYHKNCRRVIFSYSYAK